MYRIETRVDGFPWTSNGITPNDPMANRFPSEGEALAAIEGLKRLDDPTWARAEYRVRPIPGKSRASRYGR